MGVNIYRGHNQFDGRLKHFNWFHVIEHTSL